MSGPGPATLGPVSGSRAIRAPSRALARPAPPPRSPVLAWGLGLATLAAALGVGWLAAQRMGWLPPSDSLELELPSSTDAGGRLRRRLLLNKDEVQQDLDARRARGQDVAGAEASLAKATAAYAAGDLELADRLLGEARALAKAPPKPVPTATAPAEPTRAAVSASTPTTAALQAKLEPLRNKVLAISEKDPGADALFGRLDDAYEALSLGDRGRADRLVQDLEAEVAKY